MTAPTTDRSPKNAPWYVKAFVVLHLVAITIWSIPNPSTDQANGIAKPIGTDWLLIWNKKYLKDPMPALGNGNPIASYLYITGFWQYWDMFSPNPARIDFWADAEVIYRDKTTRRYLYPRMYLLPIPSKYSSERFRKFYERVNDNEYSMLWPQFALRIAYLNDNPTNPPVRVRLTRHWREVAPPGKPQPTRYEEFMFYDYVVDQKKLAQMRQSL